MASDSISRGTNIALAVLLIACALYGVSNLYDSHLQGSFEYYSLKNELSNLNKKMKELEKNIRTYTGIDISVQ
jgi:hypothetical protein